MTRVFILWAALAAAPATAAEILRTDVRHDGGMYTVEFEVRLQARERAVRALMTDYAQLTRLSDTVIVSEVVQQHANGKQRIRLLLNACVLFFCKNIKKIEDVETLASGDIITEAIPQDSDFSRAIERWQIMPDATHTRVRYQAQMVPSFFVPPLIGPFVIKSKIRDELRASMYKLEQLAARSDTVQR